MATHTLEISQPERIDINAPTVNWTEAENLTRDRAQAIEQLTNTIKADEEAFCQREREFLNSSTNFISEFKRANGNFISQETQLANKLEQELARLTSQQQTNTRDIEVARQNIETLNRDVQTATERLATQANDRTTIIGNISSAELGIPISSRHSSYFKQLSLSPRLLKTLLTISSDGSTKSPTAKPETPTSTRPSLPTIRPIKVTTS